MKSKNFRWLQRHAAVTSAGKPLPSYSTRDCPTFVKWPTVPPLWPTLCGNVIFGVAPNSSAP